MFFPLLFKEGFSCLIVGGGKVASRKVEILRRVPCSITVVAPRVTGSIAAAVSPGALRWVGRAFAAGDCAGHQLVIAATPDREVNREVFLEAGKLGVPVNVVDDVELSTVIFPAIWQEGPLLLAVSTGGVAPFMTVAIRDSLAGQLARMGKWVEAGGRFRQAVRNSVENEEEKNRLYRRFLRAAPSGEFSAAPEGIELNDWLSWLDKMERVCSNDR